MALVDAGVTIVVNLARVVEARILVGVQPYGRSFLKPVGATLVGTAVLVVWRLLLPGALAWQIAGVVVAGVVYVAALRAFGLDEEERFVWDRIRRRAFKRGGANK